MKLLIYVLCDGEEAIPIEVDCMATVQDVLDELKSAGKEHRWYKLYCSGKRPLGNTDTLADLGIGLEATLNYRRGASWKPAERRLREAIEGYNKMEIYRVCFMALAHLVRNIGGGYFKYD